MSDDAKAAVVLTTRLGDARRPSLSPRAWHRVCETLRMAGRSPGSIFVDRSGLGESDTRQIESLLDDGARAMLDLEDQLSKGIWVLTEFDDGYPTRYSRLGAAAPPLLFGVGDRSLLDAGGIGIVGSRDVEPVGAEVAQAFAEAVVRSGKPVVSGTARGVDQLAMNAAFTAGGAVIGVLADALDRRLRTSDLLRALDTESICLLTQQHPSAGFSPASAYARNKLIYALADLTVVVASADGEGGTWKGAEEALKLGLPVAVWRAEGEGKGNARLEAMGAAPLKAVGDLATALAGTEDPQGQEQLKIL